MKCCGGLRPARPRSSVGGVSVAHALGVEAVDLFRNPKPKAPGAPKSLDELRDFLEARLGSSWLALPEEEQNEWWRDVSKDEATKRIGRY